MTPRSPLTRFALLVFASMMSSCAASPPASAPPPRLILPTMATTPCTLDRLPESPTLADLEASYLARGAGLVVCEGARALAVETLLAERALQDRWSARDEPSPRRLWLW